MSVIFVLVCIAFPQVLVHFISWTSQEMEAMEESNLSTEEEDFIDPFDSDPLPFQSKEQLDKFMKSCNIKPAENTDEEDVDFTAKFVKHCSCEKCVDMYSGSYEHICCHQYSKWAKYANSDETTACITETLAFQQATNHFAVRNLLLQINRKARSYISDPPPNNKMRFAFYKASFLFIDGTSKKRQPLPSCVMNLCRLTYPSDDGVYKGFVPK